MSDLTIIYYTANTIPGQFAYAIRSNLIQASMLVPKVWISKKPLPVTTFGSQYIVVNTPRSHLNIYRDALTGAKVAKTKYIALAEDDVLYSPEHFKYRPAPGKFAYNLGCWGLYTWSDPPMFSWKGRRNLCNLICERELFIEAIEERFAKHGDSVDLSIWAEPGKYESQLGVTVRETETFWTNPPNVMFSHETALAYQNLGTRKKVGELRAYSVPYWGEAKEVRRLYR